MGESEPYTGYILFKANGDHASDYWFELGDVPLAGPQGPKGDTGDQGPKGDPGEDGKDGADGTQVIANPTLAGTEDSLTSIEIDGTKYAISGGGGGEQHLYMHHLRIAENASAVNSITTYIVVFNTSNTTINSFTSLRTLLYTDLQAINISSALECSGVYYNSSNNTSYNIFGIYCDSSTASNLTFEYVNPSERGTKTIQVAINVVSDIVRQVF